MSSKSLKVLAKALFWILDLFDTIRASEGEETIEAQAEMDKDELWDLMEKVKEVEEA